MTELEQVLMDRDDMSPSEAAELVAEMRHRLTEGEDPEELLLEIGLEPDYIADLLQGV